MPRGATSGPENTASSNNTDAKSAENTTNRPHVVKEKGAPGLRGMETTSVFRVVNFELFAKPNLVTMALGIISLTGCVAYIAYWRATAENRKDTYTAMDEDGNFRTRKKVSRWD